MAQALPQLLRQMRHGRADQQGHGVERFAPRRQAGGVAEISRLHLGEDVGVLVDARDRPVEAELLDVVGDAGNRLVGRAAQLRSEERRVGKEWRDWWLQEY